MMCSRQDFEHLDWTQLEMDLGAPFSETVEDYPEDFAPLMEIPDPTHAPYWERSSIIAGYVQHDPYNADHRGRCDICYNMAVRLPISRVAGPIGGRHV